MNTISGIHEGTISAPLERAGNTISGSSRCSEGSLRGSGFPTHGTLSAATSEAPETSAAAEVSGLISSLGSLSSAAQGLPLTPPSLPGIPQNQSYRPQPTDYTASSSDAN